MYKNGEFKNNIARYFNLWQALYTFSNSLRVEIEVIESTKNALSVPELPRQFKINGAVKTVNC